ncbi:zf-HC2 domain-containing protein [Candidatus Aquiluna sp. UB-MaderosW2red]|uniref:zf-HC2 domain-containing protein n=1 Tax=Candidatus Aquiluna sp. UB-MaderosW2red TaxID=1855377 RepID=UPI000875D370|nr:zf-HC2 domain-containing protein [Candidatus Aquiluna sp. UB-MaderosW2red]SCX09051.1 mycothiol system anti-sigma-R factor [Candidatus Aquiluna sp. UB-MaderosW2red]
MKQVDCDEVKRNVHEYIHAELMDLELNTLTSHLANCDSCEDHYDIEVVLNQVILRSCDEVPTKELAERVMNRLMQIQTNS